MFFIFITYMFITFLFYTFMTSRNLWVVSSTKYSKVFLSLVFPLTIFVILVYIYNMKQEQKEAQG